jgi:hypothetical protein
VPDLSQNRHRAVRILAKAAVLIDLRCTQQQQDRNHEALDWAGPGLNPFGIRYRSSRPICNGVIPLYALGSRLALGVVADQFRER